MKITRFEIEDLRFPTSLTADGTDAVHKDPDYSAAYVVLHTDADEQGHGFTFTIGRGNEVCAEAIRAFEPLVIGRDVDEIFDNPAAFWSSLAGDSQLRWLGPEKGVIHISMAAIVNATWDLQAKRKGKPLWKLLADMSPREIARCIDFHYITDALTEDEAIAILEQPQASHAAREAVLLRDGYPAYTTSAGWMGYSDDKVRRLCREALADGFTHFKVKVGGDPADDARRVRLVRDEIGPDRKLMIDANQRWNVDEAIRKVRALSEYDLWWIEEPTSPDDVLGHATIARAVAPIGVATGEHCANRVVFKQLLQAGAISFCQIDSCRLGGVNENLAVILMAAKFGIPVCPHAGGVGLCELVQHVSLWEYIWVSGGMDVRVTECVDHLHEHFEDPVILRQGRYLAPRKPGYSATMKSASRMSYRYPDGVIWVDLRRSTWPAR
jgi:L-fuconate dehydratase